MSLFSQIRADQVTARKERATVRANLLTTLLGEISRVKDANAGEPTDVEVNASIRRMLKGIEEVLERRPDDGAADVERAILKSYLPELLSDEAVCAAIQTDFLPEDRTMKNMKAILTYFENVYPGRVTGQQVAKLLKAGIA